MLLEDISPQTKALINGGMHTIRENEREHDDYSSSE